MTDAELVTRCRRDRDAFQESFQALYERHAPALFRFLRGMVGDSAPDCLQETFLRIFRDLDRFDATRPFAPWAFGVARNVALTRQRAQSRRPETARLEKWELPALGSEPSAAAEEKEQRVLLGEAVAELPDPEREVFLLRKTEGLTFSDVAEAVGCSIRTAKYRMRSALTLLALGLQRRGLVGGAE